MGPLTRPRNHYFRHQNAPYAVYVGSVSQFLCCSSSRLLVLSFSLTRSLYRSALTCPRRHDHRVPPLLHCGGGGGRRRRRRPPLCGAVGIVQSGNIHYCSPFGIEISLHPVSGEATCINFSSIPRSNTRGRGKTWPGSRCARIATPILNYSSGNSISRRSPSSSSASAMLYYVQL